MNLFRRFAGRSVLAVVLAFGSATAPVMIPTAVVSLSVSQTACGPDDLSKLHDILLKTSKTLNTGIKTNGSLYEQGFYGPVGSPEAVAKLHKGAQVIKEAALHLRTALTLAQGLTKETFEAGKLAVLKALADATASMELTGARTLDLILQSVAALITQAVAIVEVFQSTDLPRVLPTIKTWRLPEVNV